SPSAYFGPLLSDLLRGIRDAQRMGERFSLCLEADWESHLVRAVRASRQAQRRIEIPRTEQGMTTGKEEFEIPRRLLTRTVEVLRREGRGEVESIVFWGGSVGSGVTRVTHLFVPKGPGVKKHPFYVRVSDRVVASLGNLVDPPHLVLIGQVHTHKFEAFHSET